MKANWYKLFKDHTNMIFNDKICNDYEILFDKMYGDFIGMYLTTDRPLLSIGAGFGCSEIPLARKGYKIYCIENDKKNDLPLYHPFFSKKFMDQVNKTV